MAGTDQQRATGRFAYLDCTTQHLARVALTANGLGHVDGNAPDQVASVADRVHAGVHVCLGQVAQAETRIGLPRGRQVDRHPDTGTSTTNQPLTVTGPVARTSVALGHNGRRAPRQKVLIGVDSVLRVLNGRMRMHVHKPGQQHAVRKVEPLLRLWNSRPPPLQWL